MLRFIRRLLSGDPSGLADPDTDRSSPNTHRSNDWEEQEATDAYFDSLNLMQEAISSRDYERAGRLVRENMRHIPGWVREWRRDYDSFDIPSIPALQQGGVVLALLGDEEGLNIMRELVGSVPELEQRIEDVDLRQQDRHLFESILRLVADKPNCLQTEVKSLIGEEDGRRVANLIAYLEKAGKIRRIRTGRTHRLVLPGSADEPPLPPRRIVQSHRVDHTPPRLHEIDLESLSYVPLPRAPQPKDAPVSCEPEAPNEGRQFEIRDTDWQIAAVEEIPLAQRPDPAFRQVHATSSGFVLIDDLGNSEGLGHLESAAIRYDRVGNLTEHERFTHDVYRVGVHPLGSGLIALSRNCIAHAYDDHLTPIFETALADAPEIPALKNRFNIRDDQLKNHIRCVALSRDAGRYLYTCADEAWCVDSTGQGLWGARMPIEEGWTRIHTTTSRFGTSEDVARALDRMGLALPLTPEKLRRRYLDLAKQWHPDINPADPQAGTRMQALNAAAEVLGGIEEGELPRYFREGERQEYKVKMGGVEVTVDLRMEVTERAVADWIYAAGFAGHSDAVYLASYSGRVVHVDEQGTATRAFDIGSVPRRIVDTGDYLYLLTDARLYVLRDDALHAIVDTSDGGGLVVATSAFGLLEKKRFRWFREDGRHMGTILSKDPIRRVYATDKGMAVETRRRRAYVESDHTWWE